MQRCYDDLVPLTDNDALESIPQLRYSLHSFQDNMFIRIYTYITSARSLPKQGIRGSAGERTYTAENFSKLSG